MKEFFDYLQKGEFRIPVCPSCKNKVWPPSNNCQCCQSKTVLRKIQKTGKLIEFTKSHVKGKEGILGVVELSGIKLIGSFDTEHLLQGMEVRMINCGIKKDGTIFYAFNTK